MIEIISERKGFGKKIVRANAELQGKGRAEREVKSERSDWQLPCKLAQS